MEHTDQMGDPGAGPATDRVLPARRRLQLAGLLAVTDAVSLDGLAQRFGVSTQTVRRDLALLERQGLARRTYGGAIARQAFDQGEPAFAAREKLRAAEKQQIAAATLPLLSPGQSLFLDASTTALALARLLPEGWAGEVIATSLPVAVEMSRRPGVRLLLVGGEFRHSSRSFSGPLAEETLARLHVHTACISARGISATHGLTETHAGEAALKRIALAHAGRVLALVDSSKLGQVATHLVEPLGMLTMLITDAGAAGKQLGALRVLPLAVLIAGAMQD